MEREWIQALIELSNSFEEADKIIEKHTGNETYAQKLTYLQGMFNCNFINRNTESEEADYKALLTAIVDGNKYMP